MARRTRARRYAQAIFQIALEKKGLEPWQTDLKKITSVVGDAAFAFLLESPKIPFRDKVQLLKEQLGDINPLSLNLVYLLVNKDELSMIGEIAEGYQLLLDSYRGIEQAEVITAIPLDDKDKMKLAERLSARIDKKVVLKPTVDPGIIGGFIARVGGKLLDGSTRTRLAALKRELTGTGG